MTAVISREFDVREQCETVPERRRGAWGSEELSPDSACCVGSAESQASSQDPPQDGMCYVGLAQL